ncbi:MAG: hypothetical protein GTN70_09910 [Deltaproteobacteria bacterium]|nr:hypothetical protein [Deltaproteobacteria bacterium]
MPVSLSAEARLELARRRPNLRLKAEIIKNYKAATEAIIDVTDRVISWGRYENDSTLASLDWLMPNLTMMLDNADGYFREGYSGSIWDASPAKAPYECVLRIRLYVDHASGSDMALEYLGRIIDCSLQADSNFATAELVTYFEPANVLNIECGVRDGSWTKWDGTSQVRNSKGGLCFAAPDITWFGCWTDPDGRRVCRAETLWTSTLMLIIKKHASTGEEVLPQMRFGTSMMLRKDNLVDTDVRSEDNPSATWPWHYYNPPGYFELSPSEIIKDLMTTVAGLGSSLIDSSSFSTLDTYFAGQSPVYDLWCSLYEKKKYAEHVLEILSYAPETFLFWSYDSKLHMVKIPAYSTTPTPYVFSTREDVNNIVSIDEIGRYEERLATTLGVSYGARTVQDQWTLERELLIGGKANTYADVIMNKWELEKSISPTPQKVKKRKFEKPWFSADYGTAHFARIEAYVDNYFSVWGKPVDRYAITSTPASLEVEQGDVIALDVAERNLSNKKLLVIGKGFDFDHYEAIFKFSDQEFAS